jgi:hypothetical protein
MVALQKLTSNMPGWAVSFVIARREATKQSGRRVINLWIASRSPSARGALILPGLA